MTVLEIIAEQRLGIKNLAKRPLLRAALEQIDGMTRTKAPDRNEKARIASIVELCFAFEQESDPEEKANILRTLEEISANETLQLPTQSIENWEEELQSNEVASATARNAMNLRKSDFQRKYFSFRAKAGLQTQEAVAKKAGIRRSYISMIESGAHLPKQKTLQKLAKAFRVDVAELIT